MVKPLKCCGGGLDAIFVVTRLSPARADDGANLIEGATYRFKCQWCGFIGRGVANGWVVEPLAYGHRSGFGITPYRLRKFDALPPAEERRLRAAVKARELGPLLTQQEKNGLASKAWREYVERVERGS